MNKYGQPPRGQGGPPPRLPRKLPQGYLEGGYFGKDAVLKDRLMSEDPQQIVTALTDRTLMNKPMEYSQFRKFFSFVRQMEYRLNGGEQWESVRRDILRLPVYASDAVNRQVAPPIFSELMQKNAQYASATPDAFRKGFIIHIESVVAFWPRGGQR